MTVRPVTGVLEPGLRVEVDVPATSANLGPGFDCLGLALDWRDRCTVQVVGDGDRAEVSGEGAGGLPTDGGHLVLASARAALARLGWSAPGLALTAHNTIPHGRGLGSSSAAIVAGLLAGAGLVAAAGAPDVAHADDPGFWLPTAAQIEGHPDNVAAALFGGFVLAFQPLGRPDGPDEEKHWHPDVRAVSGSVHPDVRAVAFVPAGRLSTEQARGLLPAELPHADAAADAGRAALLVHAMAVDPSLLFEATADWLHQRYRAAAMPASAELVGSLRSMGFAAVISGAGPTVLVLGDAATTEAAEAAVAVSGRVRGTHAGIGSGFRVVPLAVGTGAGLR